MRSQQFILCDELGLGKYIRVGAIWAQMAIAFEWNESKR